MVYRDSSEVPHIIPRLFFAQGFVHAQYRL